MLSHIKDLIFVLQPSTENNNHFICNKQGERAKCSRLKIYVLMVSIRAFVFKIIGPNIFSAIKKSNFQGNSPWEINFSIF